MKIDEVEINLPIQQICACCKFMSCRDNRIKCHIKMASTYLMATCDQHEFSATYKMISKIEGMAVNDHN
jgi:hypothetical protein